AGKKFSVAGGATALETTSGAKLTCTKGAGSGEYSGTKALSAILKLTGCKYSVGKVVCQSAGAQPGEIVSNPLQGAPGFIEDEFIEQTQVFKLGIVLSHQPTLLDAECG